MIAVAAHAIFFIPLVGHGVDLSFKGHRAVEVRLKGADHARGGQEAPEDIDGFYIRDVVRRGDAHAVFERGHHLVGQLMVAQKLLGDDRLEAHSLHFADVSDDAHLPARHGFQEQPHAVCVFRHRQALASLALTAHEVFVGKDRPIAAADALYARVTEGFFPIHVKKFELQRCASRVADQYLHGHAPVFFPHYIGCPRNLSTRGRALATHFLTFRTDFAGYVVFLRHILTFPFRKQSLTCFR